MAVPDGGSILVTGAAGRVAARLRPALRDRYRLRLTDLRDLTDLRGLTDPAAPDDPADPADPAARTGPDDGDPAAHPLQPGETFIQGDLTDPDLAERLTRDVDAVLHLAGAAAPDAGWDDLLHRNIRATATLFEAAAGNTVRTLVYASSVHASGGYNDPATWPVDPAWPPRPCCRYGVSKVAGEALASLYSDQVPQATVIALRMTLVTYPPRWTEETRAWLADEDLVRLVQAALDADVRYGVYFGASGSDRPRHRLDNAERELGYRPQVVARPDGLPHERHRYPANCRLWNLPHHEQESPRT